MCVWQGMHKINFVFSCNIFHWNAYFLDKIYGWEQIMWQPWFGRAIRLQVCEQFEVTHNCIGVYWLNAMIPLLTLVREWLRVMTVVSNCIGHSNPFQCFVSSFTLISCSSCACESWLRSHFGMGNYVNVPFVLVINQLNAQNLVL